MSEAETREQLVEKVSKSASRSPIVDFEKGKTYATCAVREYETVNGPADYILFLDGIAIGVVESKRLELGPQNVLVQARRYSRGFRGVPYNFGGFSIR